MDNDLSSMLLGRKKKGDGDEDVTASSAVSVSPSTPAEVVTTLVPSEEVVLPTTQVKANTKRVSFQVYLPGDLKQRFQKALAEDGLKMSTLILTWIKQYLKQREQYEN